MAATLKNVSLVKLNYHMTVLLRVVRLPAAPREELGFWWGLVGPLGHSPVVVVVTSEVVQTKHDSVAPREVSRQNTYKNKMM